jgi:hypothetical protein
VEPIAAAEDEVEAGDVAPLITDVGHLRGERQAKATTARTPEGEGKDLDGGDRVGTVDVEEEGRVPVEARIEDQCPTDRWEGRLVGDVNVSSEVAAADEGVTTYGEGLPSIERG